MAKFMNFLLNGGKTESGLRPVDEEKIKELFLPWIHLQSSDIQEYFEKSRGVPFSRKYSGYGLGFNIGTYRGYWLILFCWISCLILGIDTVLCSEASRKFSVLG